MGFGAQRGAFDGLQSEEAQKAEEIEEGLWSMTINQNDKSFGSIRANLAQRISSVSQATQANQTLISTGAMLNGVSWNLGTTATSIFITNGSSGATIAAFQNSTVVQGGITGMNVLCLSGIFYWTSNGAPDFTIYYEPIV